MSNKRKILILGFVLLLFVLVLVYYNYNPANNKYFPKCIFLSLTGYKCPGCGSQRAIYELLHFNLVGAFKVNMFLVCSIPLVVLLIVAEFLRKKKPKFYMKVNSQKFIIGYFLCVIVWWILRNILGV